MQVRNFNVVPAVRRSKQWQPFYYANLQQIQIVRWIKFCVANLLYDKPVLWNPFIDFHTLWSTQVHVSQRGAIPLLVDLLKSPNALLQEGSTFALWRLAKVINSNFNYNTIYIFKSIYWLYILVIKINIYLTHCTS